MSLYSLNRSLATALWGNGGGALGRISSGSTVGSTVITLATPADVTNFEVGMVLNAATTDGTSGAIESGTVTLVGVDRDAGTLTASGNWSSGISSIATGDYLFPVGDFGGKLKGVPAWVPTSAPGATAFFGLDRTADVTRLGGIRISGGGAPFEQTMIAAATRVGREGGKASHLFMNNDDYATLMQSLGSKVVYNFEEATGGDISFSSAQVHGATGLIKVFADPNVHKGNAWMLQMDTWKLWTLGEIGFLEEDGLRILRNATADTYEMRLGYYGQLACKAPGWNASIVW